MATAPPTTDAAFIAQAEQICADYLEWLPKLPTNLDQVPVWFDKTEANMTTVIDRFRELDYPNDATADRVRTVLVPEFGGRLSDLRIIRMEYEDAVLKRDRAELAEVGERLESFGASPPDTEGVLASAGLTRCDEAFGPGAA